MKTKIIKISALLAAVVTIFYACSDSNNAPPTTTVAQDKANIITTFDNFYSCLNTLDDGDFSNFMLYSLFNTSDQTYNDSWIKTLSNQFEFQYGAIVLNNRLQFANRAGTYTWNNATQVWTKQNNTSQIKLIFPSRANQVIGDSELIVSSYADLAVSYTNENYWLPTNASITLKRNNNLVFSMNMSNITFDTNTNFSMPTNADITIFTAPYTHTFEWRRTSSVDFQLNYSSSTTQGCNNAIVLNLKLYDADYGNIISLEEDVKTLNGTVNQGNLKVVYAINVQGIAQFENPTVSQINNNSDAEVFYNNAKIGDLYYDENNNQGQIFITYSDGTSENVNIYVGDFEEQVRAIFANYLN